MIQNWESCKPALGKFTLYCSPSCTYSPGPYWEVCLLNEPECTSLPCWGCGLTSVWGTNCIWNSQGHISISHECSNTKSYDFSITHLENLATWVSFCRLILCCSFYCPKLSTGHIWCPCNWKCFHCV